MATWCVLRREEEGVGGRGGGVEGVCLHLLFPKFAREETFLIGCHAAEHLMLMFSRNAYFSAPPVFSFLLDRCCQCTSGFHFYMLGGASSDICAARFPPRAARFFHLAPAEFGVRGRVGNLIYTSACSAPRPPLPAPPFTRQEQLHFMTDRPCHL